MPELELGDQESFHVESLASRFHQSHPSSPGLSLQLTSNYYPTTFLQAGALLAVQLATRTRAEQEQQHQHPDENPAAAAAGQELELVTVVPPWNDYPALSVSNVNYDIQTIRTGTVPDTDCFGDAPNFGSPPRKRRRFEGRPPCNQHDITDIMLDLNDMYRTLDGLNPSETQPVIPLSSSSTGSNHQPPPISPELTAATQAAPENPEGIPTTNSVSTTRSLVPSRTPFSFFHFPGEIRNEIYSYSLHWPTSKELYQSYNRQIDNYYHYHATHPDEPRGPFPEHTPRFRAPTILLLCRAITAECHGFLRSRTLMIDGIPPWRPGEDRPMPLTNFIPKSTLQAVRRLEIRIPLGLGTLGSGWVWSDIACDLFSMLHEKNRFEHLQVAIIIRYGLGTGPWGDGAWSTSEQWKLEEIDDALVKLEVENPNLQAPCTLVRDYWIVEGLRASRALTNSKGELHASDEEPRMYPDEEIWPGSMLEFV